MTKKEFKRFEKICKDMWKELAKTGDEHKPAIDFLHSCPACEIAYRTVDSYYSFSEMCPVCPVDRWRHRKDTSGTDPHCQAGEVYQQWWEADSLHDNNIEQRKKCARTISRLKWTYLPEYKEV